MSFHYVYKTTHDSPKMEIDQKDIVPISRRPFFILKQPF